MNPNTSTEVSVRSDILKDFETNSERAARVAHEKNLNRVTLPKSLIDREDYKAAL